MVLACLKKITRHNNQGFGVTFLIRKLYVLSSTSTVVAPLVPLPSTVYENNSKSPIN